MYYQNTNRLSPGQVLAAPVISSKGEILLPANSTLEEDSIRFLKDYNCKGIVAYDPISLEELKKNNQNRLDLIRYQAQETVDRLLKTKEISERMEKIKNHDQITYTHSLCVASHVVAFGISNHMAEDDLQEFAIAALLHDLGKLCIPIEILNKKGKLNGQEWERMQKHPKAGADLLKDLPWASPKVLQGILEHHENENGTGYPQGKENDQISRIAKIIHICDVYDALTSKRTYKEAFNPDDALTHMERNAGILFDKEELARFKQVIIPYPRGMRVKLSNGQKGMVLHEKRECPTRPDILIEKTNKIVRLSNDTHLKIIKRLT